MPEHFAVFYVQRVERDTVEHEEIVHRTRLESYVRTVLAGRGELIALTICRRPFFRQVTKTCSTCGGKGGYPVFDGMDTVRHGRCPDCGTSK